MPENSILKKQSLVVGVQGNWTDKFIRFTISEYDFQKLE